MVDSPQQNRTGNEGREPRTSGLFEGKRWMGSGLLGNFGSDGEEDTEREGDVKEKGKEEERRE